MTDHMACEVLARTDFAEAHHISMLMIPMGVVAAFTLLDSTSLWNSIVGTVIILLTPILNGTAYSVGRQRVTRRTVPALSKQVAARFTAILVVMQLMLSVSLPIRISTYPPEEAGATGTSNWWYVTPALIVVLLYLYRLLIEYLVRYS